MCIQEEVGNAGCGGTYVQGKIDGKKFHTSGRVVYNEIFSFMIKHCSIMSIDHVVNSSVEELLCRFLTPPMQLCYPQECSQNLLQELQTQPAKHTDGASSSRLHSDAQVRSQNHQQKKNNLTPSLSDSLSVSVPNRILLCYSLRVSEFCYAIVRKRTTLSKTWVSVFSVSVFHDAECTFILVAPLSDGDTWRHATHI